MTDQIRLTELKLQLEAIYSEMPITFYQMANRDKSAFLITREIEQLENPTAYAENEKHWDGHELRF